METNYSDKENAQAEYVSPGLDLLDSYADEQYDVTDEEVKRNCDEIRAILSRHQLTGLIEIHKGPTVTLYKVITKRIGRKRSEQVVEDLELIFSKIVRATMDDGVICVEIPNERPSIVPLREIIGSGEFSNSGYDLPIAAGVELDGTPKVIDLAAAPHILVGGAMGQGKTVFLNSVITSLLYARRPDELKFVLIDAKKYEFGVYSKLQHSYLATSQNGQGGVPVSIVSSSEQAEAVLRALCKEMEDRYKLFGGASADNIKSYNRKCAGSDRMPYLVVVIDEYADLVPFEGKCSRSIASSVSQLAQKGGDAGIHLIIASRRPDTISHIRSRFPMRIAFRVSQMVDSRTVIDVSGAQMLAGKGDMLYEQGNVVERLQGGYIDMSEMSRVVDFISSQPISSDLVLAIDIRQDGKKGKIDIDPMFGEAVGFVSKKKNCTPELLQERLAVGYSRACRIQRQIDSLMLGKAVELVSGTDICTPAMLQDGLHIGYEWACRILQQMEDAGIVGAKIVKMPILTGGECEYDGGEDVDPLFDKAVELVSETNICTPAILQKNLKIGCNRVRRILRQMEKAGVIGAAIVERPVLINKRRDGLSS